ncbi:MAG: peptidoglycan-binding protein [Methylococcales bacterium]|nr:peptidoglycan-binding protein [Methylococcales bacterium]
MKTKISTLVVALTLTGCSPDPNSKLATVQDELTLAQEKNTQLQATVDQSNAELQKLSALNSQLQSSQTSNSTSGSDSALLPPNAKTGECYARVLTPATYRVDTKEVIKRETGYRIEVSHPTYKWTTERVLVKEASEVAELVPARYEWRTERILVKDAHEHLKSIPAVYETKTEQVLVKSAYTTWKKGRGPIERIDNSTGEIMCLIEVPAEYKTISSRILVTPARVETEQHDAEYKDVKIRVMVEGPKMVKRTIPAAYKTVKVKKIVQKGQERRIEIPALYQTVSNRVKVTDSVLEWRSILCETNTTGDVVRSLQRALLAAGHNPGPIDGVIGRETIAAMKAYQQEKNLAAGSLTIETIRSLGVSY